MTTATQVTGVPKRSRVTWVLAGLVLLSLVGTVALWLRRDHREAAEVSGRQERLAQGPRVFVTEVRASPAVRLVTLPGDVRAFSQVTLYAKVSGYLKEIRVDKGDRVKKNQILGILESPETDEQVRSAEADLGVKTRNALRARKLAPQGVMSQQELDTAEANLEQAKSNLLRAQALQEYEKVRAPFDGVITGRYADVGALLPAATGSTSAALPLVDLADTDQLRVIVYVGQDVAPVIREGDPVTLTIDERPDLHIEAKVSRLSTALDPRSRAMLCEVWIDNREYHLVQGSFVRVGLHLHLPPFPTVPSEALVMRGEGMFVAVVRDQKLVFVPIEPGVDDGKTLQIRRGVQLGELVALNVPAHLGDGSKIQAIRREAPGVADGGR